MRDWVVGIGLAVERVHRTVEMTEWWPDADGGRG